MLAPRIPFISTPEAPRPRAGQDAADSYPKLSYYDTGIPPCLAKSLVGESFLVWPSLSSEASWRYSLDCHSHKEERRSRVGVTPGRGR